MNENGERKFLHDIASPLGTTLFLLDMMVESFTERTDANPKDLKQITQLYDLAKRMKLMLEDRRKALTTESAS
jgi:DnaJ-domain-containing protein 1